MAVLKHNKVKDEPITSVEFTAIYKIDLLEQHE